MRSGNVDTRGFFLEPGLYESLWEAQSWTDMGDEAAGRLNISPTNVLPFMMDVRFAGHPLRCLVR